MLPYNAKSRAVSRSTSDTTLLKQLGDACDKNESTIRNYELGNRYPADDTLFDIASALEISPYALSTPRADVAPSALQFLFNL